MNVLLVDDTTDFRESVARALRMRGYEVVEAGSSEDVDAIFIELDEPKSPFEVVICDYDLGMLSTLDGPEILATIKGFDPTVGTCLWSGLTRDPCEAADLQIVKGLDAIDELFSWLEYEASLR